MQGVSLEGTFLYFGLQVVQTQGEAGKERAMWTRDWVTIRLKELSAERERRLAEGFKAKRLKSGFNRQGRLVPVERK